MVLVGVKRRDFEHAPCEGVRKCLLRQFNQCRFQPPPSGGIFFDWPSTAVVSDGGHLFFLRALQMLSEPFKTLQNPSKPFGALQNPLEPFGALRSPSKPLGACRRPSETIGDHRSPSEPIGAHRSPSEPFRARRSLSGPARPP